MLIRTTRHEPPALAHSYIKGRGKHFQRRTTQPLPQPPAASTVPSAPGKQRTLTNKTMDVVWLQHTIIQCIVQPVQVTCPSRISRSSVSKGRREASVSRFLMISSAVIVGSGGSRGASFVSSAGIVVSSGSRGASLALCEGGSGGQPWPRGQAHLPTRTVGRDSSDSERGLLQLSQTLGCTIQGIVMHFPNVNSPHEPRWVQKHRPSSTAAWPLTAVSSPVPSCSPT
jgi:hypothetical protein